MLKDNSPVEDSNVIVIPVNVIKSDSSSDSSMTSSCASSSNVRELSVECHEETFYPSVSIIITASSPVSSPNRQSRRGFKVFISKLETVATFAVAILALAFLGTKLAGFKAFTVMSGSMEPDFPVGAMIYVRPTNYKDLKVGDVISYVANSDKTVVTHRIVGIEPDKSDPETLRFRTQGDANASPDANLVHYKNVLGTPVLTLPYLGYVAYNIQRPPGIYIALIAGTLLLAWTFLPGTLEGRRKQPITA